MHQADTSGLFSSKGPPNFIDFQGEAQGEGQGSLGRPKWSQNYPHGAPKGSQKELQEVVFRAKSRQIK